MKNVFIIACLIVICSCKGKVQPPAEEVAELADNVVTLTEAQAANAGIMIGKMEQRQLSSVLRLNGVIDVPPQNMISISVPLGGYLKSTKLLPGMHVSKGEVIAVMQDQQYIQLQQDYLSAKAKISFLENEYNRQSELNKSQASSDKVLQQAKADYESQQVLVQALAEKLKLIGVNPGKLRANDISGSINVYSPINGFVSKVDVNIGKYVSPTEVLFELINPSDIHLALKVFERDLDKLYIGQKVWAYTNNDTAKKYECEVLLIGKDLSTDRNTDVHCHFETYDHALIPGTYMNADIQVTSTNALALPEQALVRYENKHYIFRVKADRQYEMIAVNAGETENGFTEVQLPASQNMADENYVVKGAYSLLMALKNESE